MQFWNELEGRLIEDGYPLRRLLRSEGRTAWFETETQGGDTQPAIISLTESLTDEDEVIARLQAAQSLKHPDLLEIRRIGKAHLDQTLFVYAVMEPTDQNLSEILKSQPLSKDEVRQVSETLVGALTAIHQQGLAHGRVEPSSVLAVGDAVKLRSDCLQSPGATRAGDVAGLGATLFEAFTQRKAGSANDAQINRIPAPFAEIIRNSLNARWGLPQVAAALRPANTLPATPSAATPMPASIAPASSATPAAKSGARPARVSPVPAEILLRPAEEAGASGTQSSTGRLALFAALAIAAILLLAWRMTRTTMPHPAPSANAKASLSSAAPASEMRVRTSAAKPSPAKLSGKHPAAPTLHGTPQKSSTSHEKVWRVVAYTYHHQDQAQHKADEVNHAHPDLQAAVFNPKGDPNHFLVVLGGAMDSHGAFAMRDKAVRSGAASDTYVQGFQQ